MPIDYRVSLFPSEYAGYWFNGRITLYVSTIWKYQVHKEDPDFLEHFINRLNWIIICETVCYLRSKEHSGLRVKGGRCRRCIPTEFADYMCYPDEWQGIREYYNKKYNH